MGFVFLFIFTIDKLCSGRIFFQLFAKILEFGSLLPKCTQQKSTKYQELIEKIGKNETHKEKTREIKEKNTYLGLCFKS